MKVYENLKNAWKNDNYVGAVLRIPGAIIEQLAKPLMIKGIPGIKLGAMLDFVNDIDIKFPRDATPNEKARLYGKAWDFIDNVFGQLTYDNLFWNKTIKDLGMIAVRSLGWDVGSFRIGANLVSEAKEKISAGLKAAVGKGGQRPPSSKFNPAMGYAFMLPLLIGLYGSVYQYLHTKKGPQDLQDYLHPKDGTKDKNGNDNRVQFSSYLTQIYSLSQNPLQAITNKSSPGLETVIQMLQNRNYFGDMIRNPADPMGIQLQQTGEYLLGQMEPFSITNLQQARQSGASAERQVESFGGITKAPSSTTIKSPEQDLLQQQYNKIYGAYGPSTPEQTQVISLKAQASALIKQGQIPTDLLNQIRKLGGFTSKSDETSWIKSQHKTTEQKLKGTEKILKFQGRQ